MTKRTQPTKAKLNRMETERGAVFFREPTERELEVIRLVAAGYKNREAAEKMGISVKTVETHRANIMNKLALRNVVDLITYAIRKGIVVIEQD